MLRKGNTPSFLVGMQNLYSHYGNQYSFCSQNWESLYLKIQLHYSFGHILKDIPSYHRGTCTIMFTEASFMIARNFKQSRYLSIEK